MTREDQNMGRLCHIHETYCEDQSPCKVCLEEYEALPDPATMTPDQRVAEMIKWSGRLEITFDKVHARIESLLGRPVWTHEMGLNWDGLVEEVRQRTGSLDMGKVLKPLEDTGKPVIMATFTPDN